MKNLAIAAILGLVTFTTGIIDSCLIVAVAQLQQPLTRILVQAPRFPIS